MGSSVVMSGVGNVGVACDGVIGCFIDILRPVRGSNNDNVVGVVGTNGLNYSQMIGLEFYGFLKFCKLYLKSGRP